MVNLFSSRQYLLAFGCATVAPSVTGVPAGRYLLKIMHAPAGTCTFGPVPAAIVGVTTPLLREIR